MHKEEFMELVKQYSNDTLVFSFVKRDHPACVKLLAAGKEIVPWLLERLRDSIGHDGPAHGGDIDIDNCPWLAIHLLREITNGECYEGMPKEYAGKLVEVRNFLLKWAKRRA